MLVRCVDNKLEERLYIGITYIAYNENLEPISEMEWNYLKEYDLVHISVNNQFRLFPKWRFKPESWFKQYEQDTSTAAGTLGQHEELMRKEQRERNINDIDCDSIVLYEEYTENTLDAIKINKEMINHPQHYNQGKYEVIDVIEDWALGFSLGNAIKYIARAPHKDNQLEDLKKALWYIQREIDRLSKDELEF